MHDTHEYLSSERIYTERELIDFEFEEVVLYRLEGKNVISNYT